MKFPSILLMAAFAFLILPDTALAVQSPSKVVKKHQSKLDKSKKKGLFTWFGQQWNRIKSVAAKKKKRKTLFLSYLSLILSASGLVGFALKALVFGLSAILLSIAFGGSARKRINRKPKSIKGSWMHRLAFAIGGLIIFVGAIAFICCSGIFF